jgi:predicted membrane protein
VKVIAMLRTRVTLGLLLVAGGGLLLLDQLGVVAAGSLIAQWWPLVLVALGLVQLIDQPRAFSAPATLMLVGLVLLGFTTGVLTAAAWELLWPLALIVAGIWIALGMRGRGRVSATDEDVVDAVAVFSGAERAPASMQFAGGSLLALFGGVTLDCRRAELAEDGAVLRAVAIFGGCDIIVPDDWHVRIDGLALFGGNDDKTVHRPVAAGEPVMVIRATSLFGGTEVVAKPRERVPAAV